VEAEGSFPVQLFLVHAAAEVRLQVGDRRQCPNPALAEFVAGGGILESAQVAGGDFLLPARGRAAAQDLDLRADAGLGEGRVADFAGVAAGVGEDLAHVPIGVVVGEDRAVGVGGHAVGAEVAGGGEDRVFGVVGV